MSADAVPVEAAGPSDAAPTNPGKKRARAADEAPTPTAPLADELSLPIASIMRIVKAKLPDDIRFGLETKKAFAKACSLFILYVSTM